MRERCGVVSHRTEGGARVNRCLSLTAAVVVWDSQVKDGYKRNPAGESEAAESLPRAAPLTWDGKKTSVVVEELLRNASDKAYGANSETRAHGCRPRVHQVNAGFNTFTCGPVLSWDGEASAVSKDAIEDAHNARSDTVIDEWDEEFDRGKVTVVSGVS